jgi:hypothetical membrane protein
MTSVIQTHHSVAAQEAGPAARTASDPLARVLAVGSAAGAFGFAGAVVLAGHLDPGYDHRSEAISALASVQSHSAGVMTVGFLCLVLGTIAAGVSLSRSLGGKAGRAAGVVVLLAGHGMVLVTFARQSCSNLQPACLDRESAGDVGTAHVVHNLASLVVFVLLVAGGFVLASALRRTPQLRHLAGRARVAAIASLVLMVWFGSGVYGPNGGLVQRAFLAFAFGLPVLVAIRASRRAS